MLGNKLKAQVHLIPTDKAVLGGILLETTKRDTLELRINRNPEFNEEAARYEVLGGIRWKPQHLYFTSDEEIKEGDWCLYKNGNMEDKHAILCQAYRHKDDDRMLFDDGSSNRKIGEGITPLKGDCRKIVATTNPELWGNKCFGRMTKVGKTKFRCFNCNNSVDVSYMSERNPALCDTIIPSGIGKIDTSFIEAYIKAYNEGKPITEVWLEYAYDYVLNGKRHGLKTRNNGSVIVHPVSITKEVLIEKALEIIKEECEKAGVRKYLNLNDFGYSQIERNIAERIVNLK